jgi:hypothetical protein
MDVFDKSKIVMSELTGFITRADGTIEDLGQLEYWHKNPFMRVWNRVKKLIKGI